MHLVTEIFSKLIEKQIRLQVSFPQHYPITRTANKQVDTVLWLCAIPCTRPLNEEVGKWWQGLFYGICSISGLLEETCPLPLPKYRDLRSESDLINGSASALLRSLSYVRATLWMKNLSHMKIPSFSPKITPAVVGSAPSSSHHLGFVCVCLCVHTRRQWYLLPTIWQVQTPSFHLSHTRIFTQAGISDQLKRPDFCLPAKDFYMCFMPALKTKQKGKRGQWNSVSRQRLRRWGATGINLWRTRLNLPSWCLSWCMEVLNGLEAASSFV